MSALVPHASLDPLPLEVTFSILCSDDGAYRMTRWAGLDVTFPWSSAGPWVLRVGLLPWSGPPRARLVEEEGRAEGQVLVGAPVPFLDADALRGLGERAPRPGHVGGIHWGSAGSSGWCSCATARVVGPPRLTRICWVPAA